MKKLLIVLVAFACVFTMFSCGKPASYDGFIEAIENTTPAVVEVKITSDTAFGPLSALFKTTYKEDGSFTISGSYERFNTISEGESKDVTSTVPVEITCDKDGNYSDGGAFTGSNPAATGAKLTLDKKLKADVSKDGNVFSANIKAEDTKAVLGIEFAADVNLTITKNDGKIISYTMEYKTEFGYDKIVCSYQ